MALIIITAMPSAFADSLEIPFHFQEKDHWCGQTSIKMVLDYYDIDKTQTEIAWGMGKLGYTNFGDILVYSHHQGLNAYVVDDFRPYAGIHPVIVFDDYFSHWIVLKGDNEEEYLFNDPGGNIVWSKTYEKEYKSIVVEVKS